MVQLKNKRHEAFTRLIAQGLPAKDAYREAGFRASQTVFTKLLERTDIKERIKELQNEKENSNSNKEQKNQRVKEFSAESGSENALDLELEVSSKRIMQELARVAFADIRQALEWRDATVIEENGKQKMLPASVVLKNSRDLTPDIAAAIAEVTQTASGPKIKLYDKRAALLELGKILGLFSSQSSDAEDLVRGQISDQPMDEEEWQKHYARND